MNTTLPIVEFLAPFFGSWNGTNDLRIMPTDEYRRSPSAATVSVAAHDFATISYTWEEDGKPQDGVLLLGGTAAAAKAVWADSWHTAQVWLNLAGEVGSDGVLRLTGSYAAPEGPDWGWEIHISPAEQKITMHNVVPGHDPYQVVELLTPTPR
ncbi:hypothetical protein BJG92_00362 [Arthrobacter sp. SO5]|uniref:DUF1579 domain-containing protein n=1 Tax=Arthrobacter sp. SO5 TaxID=1897055 RepID=UPI001E632BA3|nr:DUF1579 domain-containing protein [Arthrobacter sp. SO5]MCB5272853.1 hypothetical protein [Arthrobacter sp. SO5]